MKIVVTSAKPVLTQMGRLRKDVPVDVPDQLGRFLIERGDAVAFETKESQDRPSVAVGEDTPSSASLPAQASPQTTAKKSEPGASRRIRKR